MADTKVKRGDQLGQAKRKQARRTKVAGKSFPRRKISLHKLIEKYGRPLQMKVLKCREFKIYEQLQLNQGSILWYLTERLQLFEIAGKFCCSKKVPNITIFKKSKLVKIYPNVRVRQKRLAILVTRDFSFIRKEKSKIIHQTRKSDEETQIIMLIQQMDDMFGVKCHDIVPNPGRELAPLMSLNSSLLTSQAMIAGKQCKPFKRSTRVSDMQSELVVIKWENIKEKVACSEIAKQKCTLTQKNQVIKYKSESFMTLLVQGGCSGMQNRIISFAKKLNYNSVKPHEKIDLALLEGKLTVKYIKFPLKSGRLVNKNLKQFGEFERQAGKLKSAAIASGLSSKQSHYLNQPRVANYL